MRVFLTCSSEEDPADSSSGKSKLATLFLFFNNHSFYHYPLFTQKTAGYQIWKRHIFLYQSMSCCQ